MRARCTFSKPYTPKTPSLNSLKTLKSHSVLCSKEFLHWLKKGTELAQAGGFGNPSIGLVVFTEAWTPCISVAERLRLRGRKRPNPPEVGVGVRAFERVCGWKPGKHKGPRTFGGPRQPQP